MGRRIGDRKDAKLIRDLDPLHFIMGNIYPNRCDNEAFVSEIIDLTNAMAFLDKKNEANPEYKYNVFQLIVTTMLKTITLRPKMNRFIANKNYYQRNDVTASFIVKKQFSDEGGEGLAVIKAEAGDTLDSLHDKIYKIVSRTRKENTGSSTDDALNIFNKMPRFLSKFLISVLRLLEKRGWVPQSLIADDPYYASVILSNLGSIKLHSGYHHLTNWGTTSIFVVVGEIKKRAFYDEEGNVSQRLSVDLGLTVDERIGDGYYFSKTTKLIKKLLENPELLEETMTTDVEY